MQNPDRFIPIREVQTLIGLKGGQIYKMIRSGSFPRPLKLGSASRWSLNAITDWMDKQLSEAA